MPAKQTRPLPASPNGIHADMSDDALLWHLSADTIQPSYGVVTLKFTHGEEVTHHKLKIQPIDVLALVQQIEQLPPDTKAMVVAETATARSVGYTDDTWLQALAACVLGLCLPLTITDPVTQRCVWHAGGEPQELPAAMVALCRLGFHYFQVEQISSAIAQLTRDRREDDVPNS